MLKTYEFDAEEAIRHLEKVNGKRVTTLHAWFPNGRERLVVGFEGEKEDHILMYFPNCVNRFFFPDKDVVSSNVDLYGLTFRFVVREGDGR